MFSQLLGLPRVLLFSGNHCRVIGFSQIQIVVDSFCHLNQSDCAEECDGQTHINDFTSFISSIVLMWYLMCCR